MKKNTLDQLLKSWGDRNQPNADTLARLESQLRESWIQDPSAPAVKVDVESVRWSPRLWVAVAAGLLVLTMAGSLCWRSGRDPGALSAERNGTLELVRFTAEQVSARLMILDEVETLFAGQIRWVRIDADGMRLGKVDDSARLEAKEPRLAVRTVIMARKENQAKWETVWSSDVLTCADEYIEIAPDAGFAGAMNLWVHQLPDGRYVVDSGIEWASPRLARSYETRILSAGQPERILTQTTAGLEYRIYQSIEPLANGNG